MSSVESLNEALRTQYRAWIVREAPKSSYTLLDFLGEHLPHIEPSSWMERLDFGGVYINGREALTDQFLPIPCKIEYYEPKFKISDADIVFPEFLADYIFYADNHILAAYKPPGLSSMPAKEQRHFSVKAAVERITKTRVHMPSRLDVSTQGLLIMSTSPEAHAGLQQSFERRQVTKEYRCASAEKCAWRENIVEYPIGRSPLHPVLRTIDGINSQAAHTTFTYLGNALSEEKRLSIFRAIPKTGRTHQIRVHAASCGIPLAGDRFYSGIIASHLHLVSYALSLQHPVTREPLHLTVPQALIPAWATTFSPSDL